MLFSILFFYFHSRQLFGDIDHLLNVEVYLFLKRLEIEDEKET